MTRKTNIKAGRRSGIGNGTVLTFNHNETQVRTRGFKVKSGIKAGDDTLPRHPPPKWTFNHSETQAKSRAFTVKTGVKAGRSGSYNNYQTEYTLIAS